MKTRYMLFGALSLGVASLAWAATPADVIAARHTNYKAIGKSAKAIMDELKKDTPDLAVLRGNAAALDSFGSKMKRWYPKGTGPETGIKTEASPAIWINRAGFNAAADRFIAAAAALKTATRTGDIMAIKPAAGALGPTCKNCHDSFRVKA